MFKVNWKDSNDPINEYRQEGTKCAEILVPECVSPRYIIGVYVANRTAFDALNKICELPVEISTDLFFYGGY